MLAVQVATSLDELSELPVFPRAGVIEARLSRKPQPSPPCSLAQFVVGAWPILNPVTKLEWNWHMTVLCDHVQAQMERGLFGHEWVQNLVIDVPPGTTKSTVVSVCGPAWVWTWNPARRFLCLSGNPEVALRDAVTSRRLIESDWYRETFKPGWELRPDQDAKSKFENTATGFRQSKGIRASVTGDKPDDIIIDDPNDAKEAENVELMDGINYDYDNAISGRPGDLRSCIRQIIMQRIADNDLAGHVLGSGDFEHLKIPQEFELEEECGTKNSCPQCPTHKRGKTFIGYKDPRTKEGELLDPKRYTPEIVAKEKKRLGPRGYAGQHQQRPAPAGGIMFDPLKWKILPTRPTNIKRLVRAWDFAATEDGGAWTVGVLIAELTDESFAILKVIRKQFGPDEVEALLKSTAQDDGKKVPIRGPEDPGSAGIAQTNTYRKLLRGYDVDFDKSTGSKATRATPYSAQQLGGNVYLVEVAEGEEDWHPYFKEEHRTFPLGKFKDCVDAAALGFNFLTGEFSDTEHTKALLKMRMR